jgi:hypothetical protein
MSEMGIYQQVWGSAIRQGGCACSNHAGLVNERGSQALFQQHHRAETDLRTLSESVVGSAIPAMDVGQSVSRSIGCIERWDATTARTIVDYDPDAPGR